MQHTVHLERLRRHHEAARRTYDLVSLLDLSHSLRIWADLKETLPKIFQKFDSTRSFKTGIPARKVLKAAKGHEFVFSYMPGGTKTYASKGQIVSGPGMDRDRSFTTGVSVKFQPDYVELKNFCVVFRAFEQPLVKALSSNQVKRCNFVQWFGAEAVRVNLPDSDGALKLIIFSREKIIRRVANSLDGSHPSVTTSETPLNEFDSTIRYLLQYQMGGLSLPYFVLLKCAQDILEIAPKLMGLVPDASGKVVD